MLATLGFAAPVLQEAALVLRGMGLDRFEFDSVLVRPYQRRLIERLAHRIVASWDTADRLDLVRLTGHTDSRGPTAYNLKLGDRRARAVRLAIAAVVDRLKPGLSRQIEFRIRSAGARQPVAASTTTEGRARNRRVVVSLATQAGLARLREAASHRIMTYDFEQLPEAPVATASVPSLIYSESAPKTETTYVKIVLGGESPAQPMTGIFFPEKFNAPDPVDIVLYLHGHHSSKRFPADLTIDQYWFGKRFPFWRLREGLNRSEFNAVLVAPTLGPSSESGKLLSKNGLSWYLDQALATLKAFGPYANSAVPRLGNIIVACHSGGGWPMRQLALSKQQYADNIRQCWGFDCLYNTNDETVWVDWAKENPDKRLFIDYGNGGTADRSELLRRNAKFVPNISVTGSPDFDHNHVPIRTWEKRLSAAKFVLQP